MKLILTAVFGCLAFWTPIRAEVDCIDGWQKFPETGVHGAYGLVIDGEDECKAKCADTISCAAIDYNFGPKPWQGKRCWIHSEATLSASPMKTNRKANHLKKCADEAEVPINCYAGPELTNVMGYYSERLENPHEDFEGFPNGPADFGVLYTRGNFDEGPITGFRVNVNVGDAPEDMTYVVLTGLVATDVGPYGPDLRWGISHEVRFSIGGPFDQSGIHDRLVGDGLTHVVGEPIWEDGMILQIAVLSTFLSNGRRPTGLGYRESEDGSITIDDRHGEHYNEGKLFTYEGYEELWSDAAPHVFAVQLLYC